MGRILLIGGPGNITGHTVVDLLENGHEVAVLTHPNTRDDCNVLKDCRLYEGDRMDEALVERALGQVRPDAVIDNCGFVPAQVEPLARRAEGRCGQYVFISTCDIYGYPLARLPQRERDPWRATNCSYAEQKKKCEAALKQCLHETALTIVRPAYSMGPRFLLTALSRSGGRYLIPRLRAGLPVISPDDGNRQIHASNAADTGRMLARTVLSPRAMGRDYTLGAQASMTYDSYLARIAAVVGVTAKIVHIPAQAIRRLAGAWLEQEDLLHDLTGFDVSFSMERFQGDYPDFVWRHPIEEAIEGFIDLQEAMGALNDPHHPAEEQVLNGWQARGD